METPSTVQNGGRSKMRRVMKDQKYIQVFGFDVLQLMKFIVPESLDVPPRMFMLDNVIESFEDNVPAYKYPESCLSMSTHKLNGMFMPEQAEPNESDEDNEEMVEKEEELISEYHNHHTESIMRLATIALSQLKLQTPVTIDYNSVQTNTFKTIFAGDAVSPKGCLTVLTNCVHMSKKVILKRATSKKEKQIMVIEAMIHLFVNQNSFVPQIHFIGFTKDEALITCSEAVLCPSVHDFMTTQLSSGRYSLTQRSNMLKTMILKICDGFISLQKLNFSHRDSHTSNLFWDHHSNTATIIDFDWSSIIIRGQKISIPRFLYDTMRQTYATNKSVDICIFLRNVVNTLKHSSRLRQIPFFQNELTQIMLNYECEGKNLLSRDFINEKERKAAFQLYKKCTKDNLLRSSYSHQDGIRKLGSVKFEYRQGYFEWKSMRPLNVKNFIETGRFLYDFRK
jgi:hypothetical protein